MKAIVDERLWTEAFLDTPFATPKNVRTREEAMATPGCYVISEERDENNHPKLYGRVTSFDKDSDRVVVRSTDVHHLNGHARTVWIGTVVEFYAMWACD